MNTRTVELHRLHQPATSRERRLTAPKRKKECHPDNLEGMPMFEMIFFLYYEMIIYFL